MKRIYTTVAATAAAITLVGGGAAVAAGPDGQGKSSSQTPFVTGVDSSAKTTALLTSGDTIGGYTFAGIPDGIGAFDNGKGTFSVLVNHELPSNAGTVHGPLNGGAFISKWTVKNSLEVIAGEDLVKRVKTWNGSAWTEGTETFSRFCSSDLAPAGAFYDEATGTGTKARLYLTGEEAGVEGRATATVVDGADAGSLYVLPWLGRTSFENLLALPGTGSKTVVVTTDDSTPGQVYVYVGEKKSTGNDVERAGLTGGTLYGLAIAGIGSGDAKETDATTVPAGGAAFSLVEIPGAAGLTGKQIEEFGDAHGVSALNRPEDGAWDPTNRNGFYLATTANFAGVSRLWHLEFADSSNPVAGGVATIALAGTAAPAGVPAAELPGPRMMDNLTVNDRGQVLFQEDPGNSDYVAGVFRFDPATGVAARIARFDANRFAVGAPDFITRDEESSGIIPVPFLGEGKYLLGAQVHKLTGDPKTVEQGQLLLLQVAPGKPVR